METETRDCDVCKFTLHSGHEGKAIYHVCGPSWGRTRPSVYVINQERGGKCTSTATAERCSSIQKFRIVQIVIALEFTILLFGLSSFYAIFVASQLLDPQRVAGQENSSEDSQPT